MRDSRVINQERKRGSKGESEERKQRGEWNEKVKRESRGESEESKVTKQSYKRRESRAREWREK